MTALADLVEGAARGAAEAIDDRRAEQAYRDRNLLAIAFATERAEMGCDAGWYDDETDSDYPVVWAVLPTGQVSWHVTPDLRAVLADSPLPNETPVGGYDGHSRGLKNERLARHGLGQTERVIEEA